MLRRGFTFYVGGGLGAVPHQAQVLDEFAAEEEILPLAQAVCRVFARLGEKKNRARARLKFLVARLGIEEFRRLVLEERAILPQDGRWTLYLDNLGVTDEVPTRPAGELPEAPHSRRVCRMVGRQRHATEPARLRRGHHMPAAGRPDFRADACAGSGRAALQRRSGTHHG